MGSLADALKLFAFGKPVFIYDSNSREDEVDMVYHASFITYKEIYTLRTVAGGLICFVMPYEVGKELGLKFMDEILNAVGLKDLTMKRLGYGDKPAFSLWVNYSGVKTGISDTDRSLTISRLYKITELVYNGYINEGRRIFYNEFISPGHVPILMSRGVMNRRGHTELSDALSRLAKLTPATVIAEVLDEGTAMSLSKAKELARKLNTVLIDSNEILNAFSNAYENTPTP
ncbi:MAG: 3,4-dihydroxy-2-butanone-4-phosphate synthase [Sulfolobales archaeon]